MDEHKADMENDDEMLLQMRATFGAYGLLRTLGNYESALQLIKENPAYFGSLLIDLHYPEYGQFLRDTGYWELTGLKARW